MTTELTGAAKRLKECNFGYTSEIIRGGYRVTIRDNRTHICTVTKPTFEEAVNTALDVAEGKDSSASIVENERLWSLVAGFESKRFEGHTPSPWHTVRRPLGLGERYEVHGGHSNSPLCSRIDAALMSAAPELLAENERLRARVAELEAVIKA